MSELAKRKTEKNDKHAEKTKFYIAYGSNLNLEQMAERCPTAEVVGKAALRGWGLRFRTVATVERCDFETVPVLVWKLHPADELALDRYEGWPRLYHKETLRIMVDGRHISAMIYLINEAGRPYGPPAHEYYETILESYLNAGFNLDVLNKAVELSYRMEGECIFR